MLTSIFCACSILSTDGVNVGHVEVKAVHDYLASCLSMSPSHWWFFLFLHSSVLLRVSVHFIHLYHGLTILIQYAI